VLQLIHLLLSQVAWRKPLFFPRSADRPGARKLRDCPNWNTTDKPEQTADQVKSLALEYGLTSAHTAFVAVDSLTRTRGNHGTTVAVPVPVPEGVRYETTADAR